jgi:uncharacterized protein YqeY
MSLKDQLADDLKAALRAKDEARLRTIRTLRAALLEKEIAERQGGVAHLTPEQELAVVQKQAKQRRDAIAQFQAAGRDDLVAKEQAELTILETYLPQQLDETHLRKVLQALIATTGVASLKEMGKVMGPAMQQLRGQADGKRIQELVRELLSMQAE